MTKRLNTKPYSYWLFKHITFFVLDNTFKCPVGFYLKTLQACLQLVKSQLAQQVCGTSGVNQELNKSSFQSIEDKVAVGMGSVQCMLFLDWFDTTDAKPNRSIWFKNSLKLPRQHFGVPAEYDRHVYRESVPLFLKQVWLKSSRTAAA